MNRLTPEEWLMVVLLALSCMAVVLWLRVVEPVTVERSTQ